ncbi:MAG: NAD(P)/FAD-dependent oxidoreductase [Vicinamibacterales bacterium]
MSARYDLVVIGTGTAGSTIATTCRREGWSVAVVDRRPYGGTCANRGCDPKKVIVGAAHAFDQAHAFLGKGLWSEGLRMAWGELQAFKRTFTDPVPESREEAYRTAGIDRYHGTARFTGPATVEVEGTTLHARHVAIATGATPRRLDVAGAEHVRTSDDFLDLARLPDSIAFIGGGYISLEFAHAAARAGARVTVLHRGRRILEGFDPDLAGALAERSRLAGIDVVLGAEVTAVSPNGAGGFDLAVDGAEGPRTVAAALVVHGAGRVPDLGDLDLPAGGVAHGRRGVAVDDRLRSVSNPTVYAAGDAADTGTPGLTPVAGLEGRIAAANLLGGDERLDAGQVPSVAFTLPPLARVGLLEAEARERGLAVEVKHGDTSGWFSSRRLGEPVSAFKTLVETGTGRLLGAHLLGPHADEVINVFALAIARGLTVADLKRVTWAYPTNGSDISYML